MAIMKNREHGFFNLENRDLRLSSGTSAVALSWHGVVALL
jgi:hypothetical protein